MVSSTSSNPVGSREHVLDPQDGACPAAGRQPRWLEPASAGQPEPRPHDEQRRRPTAARAAAGPVAAGRSPCSTSPLVRRSRRRRECSDRAGSASEAPAGSPSRRYDVHRASPVRVSISTVVSGSLRRCGAKRSNVVGLAIRRAEAAGTGTAARMSATTAVTGRRAIWASADSSSGGRGPARRVPAGRRGGRSRARRGPRSRGRRAAGAALRAATRRVAGRGAAGRGDEVDRIGADAVGDVDLPDAGDQLCDLEVVGDGLEVVQWRTRAVRVDHRELGFR